MEVGRLDSKDWITDNDIPDPEVLPRPTQYQVMIRPIKVSDTITTKGGSTLFIPDQAKDDIQFLSNVGRVVAKGPTAFIDTDAVHAGAKNPHGKFGDTEHIPKIGDYVVWSKNVGTKMKIKGVMFVFLNDDQILMTLDDPQDINPMDNLLGTAQYRS